MVGELGATTGRLRTATVKALLESVVIHVSEADFHKALNEAPALMAEIIGTIGDRLSNADVVLAVLGQSCQQAVDRVQALHSEKGQLEELLRLREELAAMIIHDLRNPLAVISSGLELLKHGSQGETEMEYAPAVLETMEWSVQRMQRLVSTLLDITSLEAGEMTSHLQPLDLKSLIKEVVAEELSLAERSGVTLEDHVPENLPAVLGDRGLIERVLINLVDNALKFTPPGERVWIEAEPDTEEVEVAVVDTGAGIPLEDRTRVFEKFTQVQGRTGTKRGLGLGLAFCRMAVEAHGGRIWIEDGPEGNGSRLVFTLSKAA
jgi:signal transduction histidine kinase